MLILMLKQLLQLLLSFQLQESPGTHWFMLNLANFFLESAVDASIFCQCSLHLMMFFLVQADIKKTLNKDRLSRSRAQASSLHLFIRNVKLKNLRKENRAEKLFQSITFNEVFTKKIGWVRKL